MSARARFPRPRTGDFVPHRHLSEFPRLPHSAGRGQLRPVEGYVKRVPMSLLPAEISVRGAMLAYISASSIRRVVAAAHEGGEC
jgi:hypothetical protein